MKPACMREAISARGFAAARITVLDALLKLRQMCCDPALESTDAARAVTESAKRVRLRDLPLRSRYRQSAPARHQRRRQSVLCHGKTSAPYRKACGK